MIGHSNPELYRYPAYVTNSAGWVKRAEVFVGASDLGYDPALFRRNRHDRLSKLLDEP